MQYGTIIIRNTVSDAIQSLENYQNSIIESGNVFAIVKTEYNAMFDVQNDFFDVIEFGDKLGLSYVNTIVVPVKEKTTAELPDNVLYIVWFAKNRQKQFFNKDPMRESHIWKNVEWGRREKNYNPKGKDPGNVWIPTKDDRKGNITEHILMNMPTIINRLFNCSHQDKYQTLFISNNLDDEKCCNKNIQFIYSQSKYEYKAKCRESLVAEPSFPYSKELFAKVIWGTSEDMMEIHNETVDLVVTSPPYWDLKDYFKEGQIGQESYPEYLARMYKVWNECFLKLSNTGSLWININIRVKNNKPILLPKDFIKQCKKIGFHYKGILIWHKSSGIPTHDKNIVDRHEYVLAFSKSEHLNINNKVQSFSDYKNQNINGGLFWNINRKAGSVGKHYIHPAIYPNDLVSRIVESCTEKNQIILDPFLGSGTTLIASILSDRSCYGYEYNESFRDLIYNRIQTDIGPLINFKLAI
jgi:DNA modification methylase